jgi:Protein of unknown function (Hypoth_ymh)
MDDKRAHKALTGVLKVIDAWGLSYDARWGLSHPQALANPALERAVNYGIDEVRTRTRFAHDLIAATGEKELAAKVVESTESYAHPFTQARIAIVDAIAIVANREELAEIIGPIGPRLSASELHPTIWGAAAGLWDDGYHRQAVQTSASALERLLQAKGETTASGQDLGTLFGLGDPRQNSPRLRLRDVDNPDSPTWRSAHEGAAALVRGAFISVRNLVSPSCGDPPRVAGPGRR